MIKDKAVKIEDLVECFVFENIHKNGTFYYWTGEVPEGHYQSFKSLSEAFSIPWAILVGVVPK